MSLENRNTQLKLLAIHINLEQRSVIFLAEDLSATRLRYSPQGLLYELIGTPDSSDRTVDGSAAQPAPESAAVADLSPASAPKEQKEKSPTAVLPGKLQTTPQEGKPDRQGKPTAWARFLGHIEGHEGATLLSTSFHGRTREIALQLQAGDHLTAQGYLHLRRAADPEGRLSTFSVIHLLEYPGKVARDRAADPPAEHLNETSLP
jgi:hypothetical protein